VDVELVGADRFERGDHPWQVLRFTPGHYSVDGNLLDGHFDQIGCDDGDNVVGGTAGAFQHSQDAFLGGRRDRETIGDTAFEQHFHLVVEIRQFQTARPEDAAAELGAQRVDTIGIDAQRTAAGAERRKVVAQLRDAGDALPIGAQPTHGTFHLHAVEHPDQRWHGIDVVMPAHGEIGVVQCVSSGERGIVLGVDRHREFDE
jgi:hypothetical protein